MRFLPILNPPFKTPKIWFHACSFGEVRSIKPIIDALGDEVHISVITQTGFNEAKKLSPHVRFLPFELFLPLWIRPQKALVVLEAELWYMLFLVAKIKKTPTILLNARMSSSSYNKYMRLRFLYKRIFDNIDFVFAQSRIDKQRLEALGAKNVEVLGNIKLCAKIEITNKYPRSKLFTTIAASTHKNEELFIFRAWLKSKDGRLIVVPRHPERFSEVAQSLEQECAKNALSFSKLSQDSSLNTDVILVDVLGELNEFYAISDLVILGGAFEKIGGHNFVEPAFFGLPIITGEHYFNQEAIFGFIENIVVAKTSDELEKLLHNKADLRGTKIVGAADIKGFVEKLNQICAS